MSNDKHGQDHSSQTGTVDGGFVMDVRQLEQEDKLNFIVLMMRDKPETIDKVLEFIIPEIHPIAKDRALKRVFLYLKEPVEKLKNAFYSERNHQPGEALLEVIWKVCFYGAMMPEWARVEWMNAHMDYSLYRAKTFKDAFKLETRRSFKARAARSVKNAQVWSLANAFLLNGMKQKTQIKECIAEELRISKSEVDVICKSMGLDFDKILKKQRTK